MSLESDVRGLVLDHGRMVGSLGHRQVRRFLLGRLEQLGLLPYDGRSFDLRYTRDGMQGHNLVGILPGQNRDLPPLLLGAHYDSAIAAPCADDNAAAVAIQLRVAERLQDDEILPRDIVFAFFDAEEPPHFGTPTMGSVRFWKDQADARGVHCAVVQDLTGHDVDFAGYLPRGIPTDLQERLKGLMFVTGIESHGGLQNHILEVGPTHELQLVATLNRLVGDMSDHGIFRRSGVPYLFFSCGRWEHYHRPTDTPDRLNFDKMERIADLLQRLAPRLAGATELADRSGEVETTDFEISSLREAFGPTLPMACQQFGLNSPATRRDLDAFVRRLLAFGI